MLYTLEWTDKINKVNMNLKQYQVKLRKRLCNILKSYNIEYKYKINFSLIFDISNVILLEI